MTKCLHLFKYFLQSIFSSKTESTTEKSEIPQSFSSSKIVNDCEEEDEYPDDVIIFKSVPPNATLSYILHIFRILLQPALRQRLWTHQTFRLQMTPI